MKTRTGVRTRFFRSAQPAAQRHAPAARPAHVWKGLPVLVGNRRAAASVLQASRFRGDGTVFRLNARPPPKTGSDPAFRLNEAERVYAIEAAHNPEVAGSNPAPATGKALETGPFSWWITGAVPIFASPLTRPCDVGADPLAREAEPAASVIDVWAAG
jgi:hypothetical protein